MTFTYWTKRTPRGSVVMFGPWAVVTDEMTPEDADALVEKLNRERTSRWL